MKKSIVKVEKLSHRYSVQWAVRDVNFEITSTGIYGLLGSNGAGKSTIMNILCGVIKPTEGEIYIADVELHTNPVEAKKYIGFLPQRPPLHMDMTVEEYLIHSANMRLMEYRDIPEAVGKTMEYCGISHFSKRLIRNLSGGYQQRLGIAQAIIHNPELVVLDEPTNGLDPNHIVEIRNLIKEIAVDRTVMLSTHILSEVQVTCDHIYMVEDGELVFTGTVDDFDNYIIPDALLVTMLGQPVPEELMRIPGITGIDELGGSRYRLKFSDSHDIAERIIETSVSRGWRLTDISLERSSLDTIFFEISKGNKK